MPPDPGDGDNDYVPPIYRDDYSRRPGDSEHNRYNPDAQTARGSYTASTGRDPDTGRPDWIEPPNPPETMPPIDPTMIGVMNGIFPNHFVNMQAYLSANQHTGIDGTYQHHKDGGGTYTAGEEDLDKSIEGGYAAIGGKYWTDKTQAAPPPPGTTQTGTGGTNSGPPPSADPDNGTQHTNLMAGPSGSAAPPPPPAPLDIMRSQLPRRGGQARN